MLSKDDFWGQANSPRGVERAECAWFIEFSTPVKWNILLMICNIH